MFQSRIGLDSPVNIDIYYDDETVGSEIKLIIDNINTDVKLHKEKIQNGAKDFEISKELSLHESQFNLDFNSLNCIIFQQSYKKADNNPKIKIGFKPYSNFNWIKNNWYHFVESYDNAIITIDALIRLFSFPGLICFDISDVRYIFEPGPSISFPMSDLSFKDIELISKHNQYIKNQLTRFFLISPTPDNDSSFNFNSLLRNIRSKYKIPDNIEFVFATFFAPLKKREAILLAG